MIDLKKAVSLLEEASKKHFETCKKSFSVETKSQHDYVTEVDKTLQEALKQQILQMFPEHHVVGEENVGDIVEIQKNTWVIDPLDGTSNFVFELPFYGCSIAYIENAVVSAAVVIDFVHDDTFVALKREGAWLNGKTLTCNQTLSDFIGVSSGFIEEKAINMPQSLASLRRLGKFRLLGSQALHLCYVASGRFKACVNREAKIWDDIAGALIVQEAGGSYRSEVLDINNVHSIRSQTDTNSLAQAKDDKLLSTLVY